MTLSTGATLPDATLMKMGPEGPEAVSLADKLKDRKVVIFGRSEAVRSLANLNSEEIVLWLEQFGRKINCN